MYISRFLLKLCQKTNEHTNVYFINKRTQNAMDKENKFNPNEIKEQKLIVNKSKKRETYNFHG